MPSVARDEVLGCSNPQLDIYTSVAGELADISLLEFIIYDAASGGTQIYPPSGRQAVDLNDCPTGQRISTGHYAAAWTVPSAEPAGTHRIEWFFKLTPTSPEQTFVEQFEVEAVTGSGVVGYTSVQALRDEGVTSTQASDARLQMLIELESRRIDKITGQWFEPRSLTWSIDGNGDRVLRLDVPIISVASINIVGDDGSKILVDPEAYKVYNRHITQSLFRPDDRGDPRIELLTAATLDASMSLLLEGKWPEGEQNVEIAGVFGYTDPPGTTGKTPVLIEHATKLLVIKQVPKMARAGARFGARSKNAILREETRDQEVEYGDTLSRSAFGVLTGDPEVDEILAMFIVSPHIGRV